MKNIISILLLSAFTIFLLSCKNNKLSREQAEQLIRAKFNYPTYEYIEFNSREVANDPVAWGNGYSPLYYNCPQCGYEKFEGLEYTVVSEKFKNLENVGLIKVLKNNFFEDSPGMNAMFCQICTNNSALPHKDSRGYDITYNMIRHTRTYYNDAVFTDIAKPYLKGNRVAITTTNFSAITGIVQNNNNSAEVQFTEIIQSTPFGKIFKSNEGVSTRTISFTKYDDGWRLTN